MSYLAISGKLLDGFPKSRFSQTGNGSTYQYRGDSTLLSANLPVAGVTWADGKPVTGVEFYPMGRSDWCEMIVETERSFTTNSVATVLDSIRYENTWDRIEQPLELHPGFLPGGASDLFATASGAPPRKHLADAYGWENEQDPALKSLYQYKKLNSDGSVGSTISLTGGAAAFAKMRSLGFLSAPAFLPCWKRISTYDGSNAPGVGDIGQYTATPTGTGYPLGFQWVKEGDDAIRIGNKPKWERTELWRGYVKVWFDIDTLNPAGNTLP